MNMVLLTCKNHQDLHWMCKEVAYTPGHGYNGCRNIFFLTDGQLECPCPPTDLVKCDQTADDFLNRRYSTDAVLSALEVK